MVYNTLKLDNLARFEEKIFENFQNFQQVFFCTDQGFWNGTKTEKNAHNSKTKQAIFMGPSRAHSTPKILSIYAIKKF